MRLIHRGIGRALLLAAAMLGPGIAQAAPPGLERQVRDMLAGFAAALESRDLDATLAYFSDDFREWCDTKTNVAATIAGIFAANAHLSVAITNVSVAARGTGATVDFHLALTGDAGVLADSDVNADDPVFFRFLRRERGRWKFYGSQLSPPDTPGPPVLGMPVADLASSIHMHAFIAPARAVVPGDAHNGIDFPYPLAGSPFGFIAAAAGRVKRVTVHAAPPLPYPYSRYEIEISYNCDYDLVYIFEPFAILPEDAMRAATFVRRGDLVAAGQTIGELIWGADGAHVHFGLKQNGNWVCPGNSFDPVTRAAIQAQYERSAFEIALKNYPALCNE